MRKQKKLKKNLKKVHKTEQQQQKIFMLIKLARNRILKLEENSFFPFFPYIFLLLFNLF